MTKVPEAWPLLMRVEVAAAYVGLGESTFERLVDDGVLPRPIELPVRRKLWFRPALDKAVARLEVGGSGEGEDWAWD